MRKLHPWIKDITAAASRRKKSALRSLSNRLDVLYVAFVRTWNMFVDAVVEETNFIFRRVESEIENIRELLFLV